MINLMQLKWWKVLGVSLVTYTLVAGFLFPVPALDILNETIRNLYFHVTMWFAMIILMIYSVSYSIKYLNTSNEGHDIRANQFAIVGIFLGFLGIATGSLWAKFTWGTFWVNDPKLNGAAITLLIYLAYSVLRNALEDEDQRARISAVYNIFAFVLLIVFLVILPRMTDSLHPGNGGNPGFSAYEEDLDSTMRLVFYPAIVGWTLLAAWLVNLRVRLLDIENHLLQKNS